MYLADTSVWIDAFNGNATVHIEKLLLSNTVGLTPVIYTEILQGVSSEKEFNHLQQALHYYHFYELKNPKSSYEQAALIYYKCRKKGITIRSSVDCLIVQCAIENDLILLHNDQDFERIASVVPEFNQTIH